MSRTALAFRAAAAVGRPFRRPTRPAGRVRRALLGASLGLATVGPAALAAQGGGAAPPADAGPRAALEAPPNTPRSVAGRIIRPSAQASVAVPGVWVTLHRVGRDTAGPLDSARSDGAGRYSFRYRTFGSPEAIYFVSAMYGGIAYFSEPLHHDEVRDGEGEITVFDTSSTAPPPTVRGRHVIVGAVDSAERRTVIEVYELANDGDHTLVGAEGGQRPTWTAVLPRGARDVKGGQGDVSAEAIVADDGRVRVFAPFAPGIKQLSYSYTLPVASFPLSLPLERPTTVLEVLVEEPTATAAAPRLTPVDPVSVDGRTFKRFLAQDAPASGVLAIDVPRVAGARMRQLALWALVGALGVAMLLSLARAFTRRPSGAPRRAPRSATSPERLARQIADLDTTFERQSAPTEEARAAYQARRAELKAELTTLLAARADGR